MQKVQLKFKQALLIGLFYFLCFVLFCLFCSVLFCEGCGFFFFACLVLLFFRVFFSFNFVVCVLFCFSSRTSQKCEREWEIHLVRHSDSGSYSGSLSLHATLQYLAVVFIP